jgi:hypothetical protein
MYRLQFSEQNYPLVCAISWIEWGNADKHHALLTMALDGSEDSASQLRHFKLRFSLYRRLCGTQEVVWKWWENRNSFLCRESSSNPLRRTWGSHSWGYDEFYLLKYNGAISQNTELFLVIYSTASRLIGWSILAMKITNETTGNISRLKY